MIMRLFGLAILGWVALGFGAERYNLAMPATRGMVLIVGIEASSNPGGLRLQDTEALGVKFLPGWSWGEMPPVGQGLETGFAIGAEWHVYPGNGPSIRAIGEKVVFLDRGEGLSRVGLLARLSGDRLVQSPMVLAIAGGVVKGVSQQGLRRADPVSRNVVELLQAKSRQMVNGEDWELNAQRDPRVVAQVKQMNRMFRGEVQLVQPETRAWRWAGLLLVEAVWLDSSKQLPLFAVDAILEVRPAMRIVSFDTNKAAQMRMHEFVVSRHDWRLDPTKAAFLNAWAIGAERFVATYVSGYEGYEVALQRIDRRMGLVKTRTSFGR